MLGHDRFPLHGSHTPLGEHVWCVGRGAMLLYFLSQCLTGWPHCAGIVPWGLEDHHTLSPLHSDFLINAVSQFPHAASSAQTAEKVWGSQTWSSSSMAGILFSFSSSFSSIPSAFALPRLVTTPSLALEILSLTFSVNFDNYCVFLKKTNSSYI